MSEDYNFQNLSKKERREQGRQEETKARQLEQNRKNWQRFFGWSVVVVVLIAIVFGFVILISHSKKTRPGQSVAVQGAEHIGIGQPHPAYNSNPPTSGWHYSQPAEWGIHNSELSDEQVIHNLEHGGIWISYKDIDDQTKIQLETIVKQNSKSVVLSPRSANNSRIALASWGRIEKLESFDEAKIVAFIKANKNKSPEPIAK